MVLLGLCNVRWLCWLFSVFGFDTTMGKVDCVLFLCLVRVCVVCVSWFVLVLLALCDVKWLCWLVQGVWV